MFSADTMKRRRKRIAGKESKNFPFQLSVCWPLPGRLWRWKLHTLDVNTHVPCWSMATISPSAVSDLDINQNGVGRGVKVEKFFRDSAERCQMSLARNSISRVSRFVSSAVRNHIIMTKRRTRDFIFAASRDTFLLHHYRRNSFCLRSFCTQQYKSTANNLPARYLCRFALCSGIDIFFRFSLCTRETKCIS